MKLAISIAACAILLTASGALAQTVDDAVVCRFMTETLDGFNGDGPHLVDPVTQVETSGHDCAAKTADFRWSILVNSSDLNQGWQDTLRGGFVKVYCEGEALREILVLGWSVTATWTTKDGVVFATPITCS